MSKYTLSLIGPKVKSIKRSKCRVYCKLNPMSPGKFKEACELNKGTKATFLSLNDKEVWFCGDKVMHRRGKALKGKQIYDDPKTYLE